MKPNNLKLYRKKCNKTYQQVADQSGTSKSYIWEIENNVSVPNVYLGQAIAKAVKAPLSKVFPLPTDAPKQG